MTITKKTLSNMLIKYVNRHIGLDALVDWAEETIKESDFEDENFELLRDITAQIGLADVREFGLSWDDCYNYLHKLGYNVKVKVSAAS